MRKINKSGKQNMVLWTAVIIGIVALMIFVAYPMVSQRITETPADRERQDLCPEGTGILTVNAVSALKTGESVVGSTIKVGQNNGKILTSVTSGTTTFPVGANLEIFVSATDYLDKSFKGTMTCGGLTIETPLYNSSSDNPSIRIKNDDGDYMTDNILGGATNQTSVSAGETIKLDIEIAGTSLESSGEGIYVIEFAAGSGANITKVELSGATVTTKPNVHTTITAGSEVAVFKVPASVGSEKKVYTLTIELASGYIIAGGVYTDWYGIQEYIDTDGTVKYGVEDGSNTLKYENTGDFDFFINSP